MARWLDQWARRAAGESRPEPPRVPHSDQQFDRRQMLKRGAVVGAALWTAPVLQTVMAPAASASTPGLPGSGCTTGAQCGSGVCFNGTCQYTQAMYGACTNPQDCANLGATCIGPAYSGGSICAKAWPGSGTYCTTSAGCTSNNCQGTSPTMTCRTHTAGTTASSSCRIQQDCSSGSCVGGFCAKVNAGGTCASSADCTSASCNTTTRICNKRTFGNTCGANADCYSGVCTSGKCAKTYTGGTCSVNNDCYSAKCLSGFCGKGSFNRTCQAGTDCTSGTCTNKLCTKGASGSPCWANADCTSGTCTGATTTTTGTCR